MKKVLIAVLLLSSIAATSQSSGFGIKGGLNYGSVGDLEFSSIIGSESYNKERQAGYHAGIFYKASFSGIFLQPEVLYTKINTDYESRNAGSGQDYNFEVQKLDIPVLLGLKIVGPLNIKAGPSFQYILDTGFENTNIDFEDPEKQFTVGYQLGIGLTLGQVGLDLRYEGAFTENTIISSSNIQDSGFTVDSRPSQLILSISFTLDKN
ncbi:outer membrane beta-barrel protein [Dokdonia sp. Hel_I_53]|uniref:outer membrane beta-barrel protein n=1 Tax=Dokdonia sp. Hel_I_53 TaxID=1566287 RepID=UPI00119A7B3D|nr:outer membrane beta-barrel protein [Dokdonia sp. Hel_I_53]TVZ51918.1 outer membrane protein with beta-barrel domain [Dokdonia sp. Hel_I_53]